MTPDEDESGRRVVSIVHTAMLASVPLYAGVLWLARGRAPFLAAAAPPRPHLVEILFAIGAAEWAAATWVGRLLLKAGGGRAGAAERVRRFFLVRFAAAEAIAVFGLFAGFTGSPFRDSAFLFSAAAAALLLSTPSRAAWARARAQTSPPEV
jgi:hypothetical protein